MQNPALTERLALALLDTPIQALLEPKKKGKIQHLSKESLLGIIGAVLSMEPDVEVAAPETKQPGGRRAEDLVDNYAFLFPPAKLDEAMKAFDICGAIKVEIIQTMKGGVVKIAKLGPDIAGATGTPGEQPAQELAGGVDPMGDSRPNFAGLGNQGARAVALVGGAGMGQSEVVQAVQARDARTVMMLLPTNRDFNPEVVYSIFGNLKQAIRLSNVDDAKLYIEKDTVIDRARNICADVFVKSRCEWSYWMDSDMIVPFGNPGRFHKKTACKFGPEYAGLTGLEVLTGGKEKLVGGVYVTRDHRRLFCNSAGLHPKGQQDNDLVERLKNGPHKKREVIEWLGFGVIAIHRQVFEDIMRTQPELAPKKDGDPWNFFTGELTCSEDVAFCRRAAKAGHQSFLDCSLFSAHVGLTAYLP